jgi:hypothetical protein
MMFELPSLIVFMLVVVAAGVLLIQAAPQHKQWVTRVLGFLILAQSGAAFSGFYLDSQSMPPRFALAILPSMFIIVGLFFFKKGKEFLDNLDLRFLLMIHFLRIPVEWCLYDLYQQAMIPEIMTFEGRNFDILIGISAILIYLITYTFKRYNRALLIVWNVTGMIFLLNIVVHAILSVQSPIQQFGFEQPNRAVLEYPFVLLPAVVVPLVMLSHLVSLRKLILNSDVNG